MPVLEPNPTGGFVAKATIKNILVAFHLTPFGQKRLLEAGIEPGKKFPLALLADLAHQGHAWVPPTVAEKTGINWAQQFDLSLAGDEKAEPLFIACTSDGKYDDLHLVAWETKKKTAVKVLCGACRAALPERFTLNIPLPLLSIRTMKQLEAQGKLPPDETVVRSLRESLSADLSAMWEEFRRHKAQRQTALGFDFPGELGLK
jgi:hypothetical protein